MVSGEARREAQKGKAPGEDSEATLEALGLRVSA